MNRSRSIARVLVVGAAFLAGSAAAQTSNRPAVLGGDGRFVFGQINEYNADQYMLDTATGRLWRLVDTVDGSGSVLEIVAYALPDGRTQQLPTEPGAAPAPPALPDSFELPAPPPDDGSR